MLHSLSNSLALCVYLQGPVPGGHGVAGQQQQQGRLWKKNKAEARVRRSYRTASEVLGEAATKPLASQPILDMRGPQARIITNLEHLNARDESGQGEGVPMPELQHNMQLLVDMAEADIQKLDAKLRHEQDTATLLAREQANLKEQVGVGPVCTTLAEGGGQKCPVVCPWQWTETALSVAGFCWSLYQPSCNTNIASYPCAFAC
jgi:hypothetical protein